MRILVIAYDYPPTLTPRALRWRYFSRELALQGHEVHMLVPDLGDSGMEHADGPGRITVHYTFPGLIGWISGRRRRRPGRAEDTAAAVSGGPRLNWRGRTIDVIKRLLGLV